MSSTPVEIRVTGLDDWIELRGIEPRVIAAAEAALATEPPRGGELSIAFVSASRIRLLNDRFHAADVPTDVLAFDLRDGGGPLVGDLYVCPDVASASARDAGCPLVEEILRLVIHGTLHLVGHDHPDGEARWDSPMFELQERLLASL